MLALSTLPGGAAGGRTAGQWRITLHAYGDTDNLHLDLTSDPPLAQEDIVLLLTVGMTRTELDQLQQSGGAALGAGVALEALSTATGADRAVTNAIPVIDDFRFGSGYSSRSGRTEPQVTIGKRITDDIRASVTTGLSEDRARAVGRIAPHARPGDPHGAEAHAADRQVAADGDGIGRERRHLVTLLVVLRLTPRVALRP